MKSTLLLRNPGHINLITKEINKQKTYLMVCRAEELRSLRAAELESLRAGELESWRAGELESWRAGELE